MRRESRRSPSDEFRDVSRSECRAEQISVAAATTASARRGPMGVAFPGESPEYRAARDRLLEQEIELRRAMEAVAAARRTLPPGGAVPEDYVFSGAGADGTPIDVRLSELFAPGKDSLVIYSFMFPRDPGDDRPGPASGQTALLPRADGPCPSCVAFLDQLDGVVEHAGQHLNVRREGSAGPHPDLRRGAWLAATATLVLRRQHLQPRLSRRDRGGGPEADVDGVPPRRRCDPPFLELGALLCPFRPGAGTAPRRHPRAALEPARPHARGTPDRLG